MPLVVRACELRDLRAITAIYGEAVRHGTASFELEPPGLGEMEARWRLLMEGGHPYLVAADRGEVAGYAYSGAYRTRPAYRGTVESSVYVGAGYRRRGIALRLMSALLEAAATSGFRQMVAVIGDSANLASVRLHEAAGFSHAGVLRSVGWKHGRWLDTVLMQRALGLGDAGPPPAQNVG